MKDLSDIRASEYALGMLSEGERMRVEELAVKDPFLARRIAWWTDCFSPLSAASEEIPPPDGLLERIEEQLDRQDNAGGGGSVTVREAEGRWIEIAPGARKKHLYYDDRSCSEAFLIELDPGISLPEHEHEGTEDCLVISGDFSIGDLKLRAGDFHAAFAASRHAPCRSETGCRLFIKAAA
ncbi:MAG: cupin domain-containing protein [Pseudomonadota bacterium]